MDLLKWLWPIRTGLTIIDVWTLFHTAFWLFAGSCFWSWKIPLEPAITVALSLAYVWEAFERFAEPRWPHLWLNPESWANSYISDPLTAIVGVAFAYYALDNWRV